MHLLATWFCTCDTRLRRERRAGPRAEQPPTPLLLLRLQQTTTALWIGPGYVKALHDRAVGLGCHLLEPGQETPLAQKPCLPPVRQGAMLCRSKTLNRLDSAALALDCSGVPNAFLRSLGIARLPTNGIYRTEPIGLLIQRTLSWSLFHPD